MLPLLTFGILLISPMDSISPLNAERFAHKDNMLDDDVDGAIEGPMLTLSCTLCEQFFNITLRMRNSSTKKQIELFVHDRHCGGIGIFKGICNEAFDKYYDSIYSSSGAVGDYSGVKKKCQDIGLCPGNKIPQYCKTFYDDGGPLIPNKYPDDYDL
ncbi:hypothetical protein QR680_002581 [Steinernema hermaphroditum]|uniref:Saposin B-type domain-containing protein n=1 Tax=Steinernema hermaphroditum TaxID=289476 RepID=A0AA39H378_9BILA|nr:hypothetical protein QR680_002581 [Steinernema hermaphroditum]